MSLAPAISLPRFTGPLDLLLVLVRANEIEIADIPIAQITRQYLDYMAAAGRMDLDLGSEFAYMAATLIQIKARSLLPQDPEVVAREENPRQELIRQLLDHAQVRRAAEFLGRQLETAGGAWSAAPVEESPEPVAEENPDALTLAGLLELTRKAVETARTHELLGLDEADITVQEMSLWLEAHLLAHGQEGRASEDLFAEQPTLPHRIALFLAMLELSKAGRIGLQQRNHFEPIDVKLAPGV